MCFFYMLRQTLPFEVEHAYGLQANSYFEDLLAKVKWDGVTRPARHLIQLCLSIDMRDRPSAQVLLHHRFLARRGRGQPMQSRRTVSKERYHSGCYEYSDKDPAPYENIHSGESDKVGTHGSCRSSFGRASSYPCFLAHVNNDDSESDGEWIQIQHPILKIA
jgi:serine/threonine protein kinase